MRTLQQNEVHAVSGAGVLTSVVKTGVQAGAALGQGFYSAAVIVGKPLVSGVVNVIKFLV